MNRRSFWSRIAAALGIAAAPRVLAAPKPRAFNGPIQDVTDYAKLERDANPLMCSVEVRELDGSLTRHIALASEVKPLTFARTTQLVCEQCDGTFWSRGPAALCGKCSDQPLEVRDALKVANAKPLPGETMAEWLKRNDPELHARLKARFYAPMPFQADLDAAMREVPRG